MAAEFAVVVLGVIVALGVDEWRRSRAELAEEASYYARLADDIDADIEVWERLLSLLDPKQEALERIESWLRAPSQSDDAVLRGLAEDIAMGAVFAGSVPPPRQSTYTELLSTGRFGVIRDAAFRASLIDYHFEFENLRQRLSSRVTGYERVAYSLVPREVQGGGDNVARTDLSSSELRVIADIAAGSDLRAVVVAEHNRTLFLRAHYTGLVDQARALLTRAAAAGEPGLVSGSSVDG